MKRLQEYRDLLATDGVEWGLIGPREVDRLWDRHIDNCLAVTEDSLCLPDGVSVLDIGSGAGLPGIVWAIARPDLRITLVEPLQRRIRFLERAAELLDLEVAIVRSRAQDLDVTGQRVTARAVSATRTLLPWLAPLVSQDGCMVLLKGQRAEDELVAARPWLGRHHWDAQVRVVGDPPRTRVVVIEREVTG